MKRGDSKIPAADWANPKEGRFLLDTSSDPDEMTPADPWDIVAYEVKMFYATYEIVLSLAALDQLSRVLANAVEESAVLHTRNLCDVFFDNEAKRKAKATNIYLSELFSDWGTDTKYDRVQELIGDLSERYDRPARKPGPGTNTKRASPRWNFTKMMAHPTTHRGISFDYTPDLRCLRPVLQDIIDEIEFLRRASFATGFRDLNLLKLSVTHRSVP
jgi:hypothetical protein